MYIFSVFLGDQEKYFFKSMKKGILIIILQISKRKKNKNKKKAANES